MPLEKDIKEFAHISFNLLIGLLALGENAIHVS